MCTPHECIFAENTCAVNFKVGMVPFGPAGCNEAGLFDISLIITAVQCSFNYELLILVINFACFVTFSPVYTSVFDFEPLA